MLTVEDGTGLPNAESYVSTAELASYLSKWGLKGVTSVTADQEVLLRKATRAVDAIYSFIGNQASNEQTLQWPRVGRDVPPGVPQSLKDATCEMAYVYVSGDPLAPQAAGSSGLVEITKQVDSLKTTKKWADGQYTDAASNSIRKVTFVIQPLLDQTPGSLMVGVARG